MPAPLQRHCQWQRQFVLNFANPKLRRVTVDFNLQRFLTFATIPATVQYRLIPVQELAAVLRPGR